MISLAATFAISSIVCSEPPKDFRQFFDLYYAPVTGAPHNLAPIAGELVRDYVLRITDASAAFLDYRAARFEKCGAPR